MRIGLGFDAHPFETEESKPLILGGVLFDNEAGLKGHSDADVIAHSCSDALLGAANLGDIGQHFPDTDPKWKGANSMEMLKEVTEKVKEAGFEVANLDCVVVCDHPKISTQKENIQKNLSNLIGAPVSVGGKRTEGMNGSTEGITCLTVALLNPTK